MPSEAAGLPLSVVVHRTIDAIPPALWDRLAGARSIVASHRFWRLLEASRLDGFDLRYLVVHDATGAAVAAAPAYRVATDIAIFAPGAMRRALVSVRRLWPGFLKMTLVECGTPVTLCEPPVGDGHPAALRAIATALDREARDAGALLVVLRDFEPQAEPLLGRLVGLGFRVIDGLPNTRMAIRWTSPADYHAELRSYYRSKLLKHLRRVEESGVRHERIDDFAALADVLWSQWRVVHEHAREFQREVLTPTFYRNFSAMLGGAASVLVFRRSGEPVAHTLLLRDGRVLRWMYFGRKDAANDSLYIYAAHAVIEAAIAMGVDELEMGLTTYPIKQDLGGQLMPLRFVIRSRLRWATPLAAAVYRLLNRVPASQPRAVFRARGAPTTR